MPLDADSVEKLRATMASSGWNDVIEPSLINRSKQILNALRTVPGKRSGEFKELEDHDLRAKLDEIEWLLVAFRNEIKVFDHNRRLDELDADRGEPVRKEPRNG